MITYLLPTRDRHDALRRTLQALGSLDADAHDAIDGAEVIVVDNASTPPVSYATALHNGLPLRVIRRECNEAAAARNFGAQHARGEWIVMLDDDSHPLGCGHIEVLRNAPRDMAAIGAEIVLPSGQREAGGLPEVIIGCGAAIRREAFLELGGYDPDFDYYAEEYDLCARFLLRGWRIVHDRRFRVLHEKVTTHRDMNRILYRLVRNNGWVAQRYAPAELKTAELNDTISRYAGIAVKEQAAKGFALGVSELIQTFDAQPDRSMPPKVHDRFTGLAHARTMLADDPALKRRAIIAIIDQGKNSWAIRRALHELGVNIVEDENEADVLVIGTLSPGPMLDAFERRLADPATRGRPVLCGWSMAGQEQHCAARAA